MENSNVENAIESKSTKEKVLFILKIVGNVIFYLIIIMLFLFSIMNINSGGANRAPNIFGKGFLSVQSNSMEKMGDYPAKYAEAYESYEIKGFSKGDLLNVDILNENDKFNLKVGDVITFETTINGTVALNTHRIVYASYDENNKLVSISTQGDYSATVKGLVFDPTDNDNADKMLNLEQSGDIDTFNVDNFDKIIYKVTGVSKGAGAVLDNIQANWLWYFVFPVAVLLIFELFMVIKNFMDLKGTKQKAALATDKEALLAEVQAEKEKMRQELLAELKAQQEAEANATKTETVEEVKEETPTEEVEEPTETSKQETKSEEEQ